MAPSTVPWYAVFSEWISPPLPSARREELPPSFVRFTNPGPFCEERKHRASYAQIPGSVFSFCYCFFSLSHLGPFCGTTEVGLDTIDSWHSLFLGGTPSKPPLPVLIPHPPLPPPFKVQARLPSNLAFQLSFPDPGKESHDFSWGGLFPPITLSFRRRYVDPSFKTLFPSSFANLVPIPPSWLTSFFLTRPPEKSGPLLVHKSFPNQTLPPNPPPPPPHPSPLLF